MGGAVRSGVTPGAVRSGVIPPPKTTPVVTVEIIIFSNLLSSCQKSSSLVYDCVKAFDNTIIGIEFVISGKLATRRFF